VRRYEIRYSCYYGATMTSFYVVAKDENDALRLLGRKHPAYNYVEGIYCLVNVENFKESD
jgi:hypothetical protein